MPLVYYYTVSNLKWKCPRCGFEDELFREYYWKCLRCGSPLEIDYRTTGVIYSSRNMWERYRSLLPFSPEKTRGEGLTPLVEEKNGSHTLLFKLEYLNPGGSFKDRGSALAVYYGYKMGFKKSVVDTSGNTGISVALYSRLYGMEPLVIMPKTAPIGKKRAVSRIGGNIIEAEDRLGASKLVEKYIGESGVYYVAHLWNPLYIIGSATMIYEVYEDYGIPDYVIVPIGSGGLILGVVYGLEMLKKFGLAKKTPKIIGVQGYSCQPVYEAMYKRREEGEDSSLADGIMVANPPRVGEIVEKVKATGGKIMLVGNSEINRAYDELWNRGFLVEPTSAVVYAAYRKMEKEIVGEASMLLVLTGSGLKTPM